MFTSFLWHALKCEASHSCYCCVVLQWYVFNVMVYCYCYCYCCVTVICIQRHGVTCTQVWRSRLTLLPRSVIVESSSSYVINLSFCYCYFYCYCYCRDLYCLTSSTSPSSTFCHYSHHRKRLVEGNSSSYHTSSWSWSPPTQSIQDFCHHIQPRLSNLDYCGIRCQILISR